MRTTVTLDDDVVALVEDERRRSGESFRETINRLLRRGARRPTTSKPASLAVHPGQPRLDVRDVSAVLAALDDERRAERGLP